MGHPVQSKISIGASDISCGMQDMEMVCESDNEITSFMPQSCCDNDHLSIQIEDDYQLDSEAISLEKQFLFAFTYAFLISNYASVEQISALSKINSPPLETDFQAQFQIFLL